MFSLKSVSVAADNVLGSLGGGLALTAACFTGAAALVGIFAVGLMRAAFEFTLDFARTESRGGVHPIIEHQAVGYALADAKMAIEATRCLSWRACRRSMCNRPPRRNWRSRRKYMVRKRPCGC